MIVDMSKFPQYKAACELASKWHDGQFYGDSDKPYMYHLFQVVKIVKARNKHLPSVCLDNLMAVAMLHDILEDTKCRAKDLEDAGIHIWNIISVVAITKVEEEKKRKYLRRVAADSVALEVKVCDTATNLEHSVRGGSFKRVERYAKQLEYLNERQRQGEQE